MTDSKIYFSIVIPAFNESHYIAETLSSLKDQTFKGGYEVIVVDNNSTDQTAAIARSLGAKVILERQPGVCWARQAGTKAALGQIVISTDADTTFSHDWLARIYARFVADDTLIGVSGPCHYVNGPLWGEIYPRALFGAISVAYKLTGHVYYGSATNIAFRKSAWSGYDTSLTQGGDELDLLKKLQKAGRVVFDNGNPTYTSARRLVRGFIYNFFITFLLFYILEYNLSRLFKRPVLASAPKIRNEFSPKILPLFHVVLTGGLLVLFFLYTPPGHYSVIKAHKFVKSTAHRFDRDGK